MVTLRAMTNTIGTNSPDRIEVDLTIVDDPDRLIALDGVHNFRDLGGYVMGDGRMIGWGRLFRADGLHRLTDDDLDLFDAIGVRTVVDLRSAGEVEQHGTFPFERHAVAFHALPVIDATWRDVDIPEFDDTEQGEIDFLTWAYRDMLAVGGVRFAQAIRQLAIPGSTPAVFHCAAGKDRTGVLAALVLAGLGVHQDVIVADYGLTRAGMERMLAWVGTNHPEMAARMSETPSFMLAAHPQAMANTLDGLISEYGSIRNYLTTIGIGDAILETLAEALTD